MADVLVEQFYWDDFNIDKVAQHSLRAEYVDEVLYGAYRVDENRASGRAPYLLIGRTEDGQCVAIPIEPTNDPAVWRPVTAWRCKPFEWARLGQLRRRY